MDHSARSLGRGPLGVLREVHWPLLRRGLAASALLVFIDCLKELPATLVLRPFDFDTLAVVAFQFASDERLSAAALPSLVIVIVGLAPVVFLSRIASDGSRDPWRSIAATTLSSIPFANHCATRSGPRPETVSTNRWRDPKPERTASRTSGSSHAAYAWSCARSRVRSAATISEYAFPIAVSASSPRRSPAAARKSSSVSAMHRSTVATNSFFFVPKSRNR